MMDTCASELVGNGTSAQTEQNGGSGKTRRECEDGYMRQPVILSHLLEGPL